MPEEIDIIKAVLDGDVESFRLLVERYQGPVIRMIRNITDDAHACEDIAQDVFVSAFEKLASFDRQKSSFSTWIFTIARNKSINAAKRKKAFTTSDLPENADFFTPADNLEKQEFFNRLDKELSGLGGRLKRAFVLAELEKLPYEQIARIEKTKTGTIKSRVSRAKEKLRLALKSFREEDL